ncbi:TetR/AcrR family transcriptional regulator [Mycolicibacterium madagascariense]|uniref:TetR/AcrR family transcriptional regulator n=1 Tax=Mycolicibacterium madagascariense TaxID=212765 RepID=UPI0013D4C24B|nr:TetR/AcrR family transcriptional regulator [Mycolicibacterium madagascariense]MCV7013429.1 TetR/AcrR family transcriptional regulator [Mycolicibacterium madagascariense]
MAGNSDGRVERSKAAVLAETYRQLTLSGLGGVSVDEVARNSGVAKTTIYRHWPSRSALLIDACSRMGGPQPAPDTGSVRTDLLALATAVAEQLWTAAWPSVLPSIIDAAERDPDIADMFAQLHQGNMAPFREVVARGRERGELRPDTVVDDVVTAVMAPLFYRRWFAKERVDDAFVHATVDHAIRSAQQT